MKDKALGLLGIARKGGNVAVGEEPVGAAARDGKARLIILASDAADHTVRRASSFAALHQSPLASVDFRKEELGARFGRKSVAMLAITDVYLAQRFLEALEDSRCQPQLTAVREKAAEMKKRKQQRPRAEKGKK